MTTPVSERPARIAVVYYSASGNVHKLARAIAEGAAREGAEVRPRHVAELSQEMLVSAKQYWGTHRSEIEDEPVRQTRPPGPRRPAKKPPSDRKPQVDVGAVAPADLGFYSVDSKPYATIYIDDKSFGDTPLFKVQLPPGKHRVRAVRADGKSKRLTITVQPGKLVSSGTLGW